MEDKTLLLYDRAIAGDKEALEKLLLTIRDMVFNLSLRMLGSVQDAEDATQEIYIRIMTGLSSFQKESAFSTWAYRVAANHLLNTKRSMFANMPPMTFAFYGEDIERGFVDASDQALRGVDQALLAEELKMSCTNVMLQCFDPESRLLYVLGTMFRVDSKTGGDLLGITPEAYRQRLSRLRQKMGDFLASYCGLSGSGKCACRKRVGYAIQSQRLHPERLEYTRLGEAEEARLSEHLAAMEDLDAQSAVFAGLPRYQAPQKIRAFLTDLLASPGMATILKEG